MNPTLAKIIRDEELRQSETIDLIPSENIASKAVREAVGSVLMHKYSEGYPTKRYYEGNHIIDQLESLAISQVKKLFKVEDDWHANVQVLSGSIANLAVYNAVLKPGDKILSMYLPDGGHLSHGWSYAKDKSLSYSKQSANVERLISKGGDQKVSIVSKIYDVVQYKTDPKTMLFDYEMIQRIAEQERPKLIVTGGTAYPREIDYERMNQIAKSIGAYYLADVAHEAGLIAGGAISSPFEHADFVTFTTHKTLRGPRGAIAMCRKQYADKLDRSVFPGIQGGPFNHNIAGIAQALFEADTEQFQDYALQVVKNAQVMAEEFIKLGYDVISGGTDKHLVLINVIPKGLTGKFASSALATAGIVSNMNSIPWDERGPFNPSGLRLGTPSITTRGMKEGEVLLIVKIIDKVLTEAIKFTPNIDLQKANEIENFASKIAKSPEIDRAKEEVKQICSKFKVI